MAPPKVMVLVQKIENYLKPLGVGSGYDHTIENWPDKAFLILAVATLSDGKDEIFEPDFRP